MIGILAGAHYGYRLAFSQAEFIWQPPILGLTVTNRPDYHAFAFHLWIKPKNKPEI